MTEFVSLAFVGGPLDGAIRPVPGDCVRVPMAAGAVIHVYVRDEVFDGKQVRQIMRHHQIIQAWAHD